MTAAVEWLAPVRASVPEVDEAGWAALRRFAGELARMAAGAPPATESAAWSRWLAETRRGLTAAGHRAPAGPGGWAWQLLAQFVAGFHDLDLRDCTGPGHGAMILAAGHPVTASGWRARLDAGELVGIAATERHGGSRIQEITTRARVGRGGRWLVSGEKCWVSRLVESAGYVVFFRDPDGRISVAIIDAAEPGLERVVADPCGLGGWSWGVLRLHEVPVEVEVNLLGAPGEGLAVFRRHFTGFRPLVTATALGTAAGVHRLVVDALGARVRVGVLSRVRDNALMTLGQTYAEILAGLAAASTAARLAAAEDPLADLVARCGKAAGVDAACRVVGQLAPLIGAAGFQRAHPVAKARADLAGLLYADGIHDSLYRAAGKQLLRDVPVTRAVPVPVPMMARAA